MDGNGRLATGDQGERALSAVSIAEIARAQRDSCDGYSGHPLPPAPTTAAPGTPEKVKCMAAREKAGYHLHHPRDATLAQRAVQDTLAVNGRSLMNGSHPLRVLRQFNERRHLDREKLTEAERDALDNAAASAEYDRIVRQSLARYRRGRHPARRPRPHG